MPKARPYVFHPLFAGFIRVDSLLTTFHSWQLIGKRNTYFTPLNPIYTYYLHWYYCRGAIHCARPHHGGAVQWKFSGERKMIGCHFSPSEMAYCGKPCKLTPVSAAWCKPMSRSEPRRGSVVVVKHTQKKQPATLLRITHAARLMLNELSAVFSPPMTFCSRTDF